MKQGNRIWNLALIFILIALLTVTSVSAGFFGDVKDKASDIWNRVSVFVASWTFWINIAIIFGILFIVVQFVEQIRARFDGNREWIMYVLLLIISILIAVSLKDSPIYSLTAIKWLFNWKVVINTVITSIVLYLIMQYIPEQYAGPIRNRERGAFFSYFLPIIIALMIVHQVAQVDSLGNVTNDAYIWNSNFWLKIERFAFGDRADANKFGNWIGWYEVDSDEGLDARYGILYWKKIAGDGLAGEPIKLLGKTVQTPNVSPIMIFLLTWLISYLFFMVTGLLAQNEQMHLPNQIRNIVIIWLAALVTSQGVTLSTLVLMFKIYLFIVLFQRIRQLEDLSIITRFVLPWLLSEAILSMFLLPTDKLNFEWAWTLLGFEIAYQVIPIIWPYLRGIWHGILNIFNWSRGLNWTTLLAIVGVGIAGIVALPWLLRVIFNQIGHWIGTIFGFGAAVSLLGDKEKGYLKAGAVGFSGILLIYVILKIGMMTGKIVNNPQAAVSMFMIGVAGGFLIAKKGKFEKSADDFKNNFEGTLDKDAKQGNKEIKQLIKDVPAAKDLIELIMSLIRNGQSEKVMKALHKVKEMKATPEQKREQFRILLSQREESQEFVPEDENMR